VACIDGCITATIRKSSTLIFLRSCVRIAGCPAKTGCCTSHQNCFLKKSRPGFARNSILCEELQMKAEVLVNLAKEAGLRVEDLLFIRQHREEFEKLKKSVKEKPSVIGAVADAVNALLGSDTAAPSPIPDELNKPEQPAGSRSGPSATDGAGSSGGQGATSSDGGTSTGSRTASQDGKYITYIYVSQESREGDHTQTESDKERRAALSRAGLEFVLDYEQNAGRHPTEMPQTNEGYDVESRNGTGEVERYIEVKSISAAWGERGVTLSHAQFKAAQQHKNKFWLYVVENADTAEKRLHRIPNPAKS